MTLLDEWSRPSMRERFGNLMRASTRVDLAIAHLRLAGLDLDERETGNLGRLRVVVGHLDAEALMLDGSRPATLQRLYAFAISGRLHMRTVPRFQWNPDFSIFDGHTALIGAHYNERPYAADGIAFTIALGEPAEVGNCARRFDAMWRQGYDVLPIVVETLEGLLREPALDH